MAELAQVEVKIAKGEYLGIYEEKKVTFRQFAPEYLGYSQANKSRTSYNRDRITIDRWLIPFFGGHYLFQISLADTERYKQERLTMVDPSTVNKEVNCLKAMLNKAIAWGYLQTHPLRGMKGLREPPGRLRYLTPEEKARLLDACASHHISVQLSISQCTQGCDARKSSACDEQMLISAAARLRSRTPKIMSGG